ncbi:MAG: hypothetical protein F6K11_13720 [Leptolyngbya sp. SIO3F4]|nr:hypothetical protein [Leptolyngbya sp. SIO3F4]
MVNIHQLLSHFINTEQTPCQSDFLAPCIRQGCLRTYVNGLAYTFNLRGWPFEGWGLFRPASSETATLIKEASLSDVNQYLRRLPAFRLYLVHRLQHRSWLAYPINESDTQQRLGMVKPMVVHLVADRFVFDQIIARWDGNTFWFDQMDPQASVTNSLDLRESLTQRINSDDLCIQGLTPEKFTAYDLAVQQMSEFSPQKRDTDQLRKVSKTNADNWQDQENYLSVDWKTADGQCHTNALTKEDLAVVSTGIYLRDCDVIHQKTLSGVVD